MNKPPFSVCVFCGARAGAKAEFATAARSIGRAIGHLGWQLVYGGGKVGLMGELANAVLTSGGRVVGVIPETLMLREVGHLGLSELHVVRTMHERKQLMHDRADAFLALPGGIGTLEELFEVWTWRQLGYHDMLVGLLNVEGYFDDLITFISTMVKSGFLSHEQQSALIIDDDAERLLLRLQRPVLSGSTAAREPN